MSTPATEFDAVTAHHVQVLWDRQEISDVMLHFGRGLDLHDWDLYASTLHDPFEVDFFDPDRASARHHHACYVGDTIAAELREVVRRLAPDAPITVMEHDWGAVFAYCYAAQYSNEVATLGIFEMALPRCHAGAEPAGKGQPR